MESYSEKHWVGGHVLAAGFVGVIVGALVTGFTPIAKGLQSPPEIQTAYLAGTDRLTVELYFQKQEGSKWLKFNGCQAREGSNQIPKNCTNNNASLKLDNQHLEQMLVRWNGLDTGSGCARVGGVEYCW